MIKKIKYGSVAIHLKFCECLPNKTPHDPQNAAVNWEGCFQTMQIYRTADA